MKEKEKDLENYLMEKAKCVIRDTLLKEKNMEKEQNLIAKIKQTKNIIKINN